MSIKRKSQKTANCQRKRQQILGNKIKVNFAQLSEVSKRSCTIPGYYESYTYKCIVCGQHSDFSASLQQEWYEVKKKYFWMRPKKCGACYTEYWNLKREIVTFTDLLKTSLTISELTEMLVKIDKFCINSRRGYEYSGIKKIIQSKLK
jgi:hypothetical protein